MEYTNSEYCDMLLILGQCNNEANVAARRYAEIYPHRRHPDAKVIRRAETRLRETGSVIIHRPDAGRGRNVRMIRIEEEIIRRIQEEPRRSIRFVSNQMNVPRSIVHRVLRNEDMHPYHFSSVQHFREGDAERRLEFCRWLIFENNRDNTFCSRILFSDESLFTREGLFNAHNMHYWAEENPFVIRERSFQVRWNLNIWAGIIGNELIGPCVLPNRIRGNNYADFLRDNLPDLLEDVPLNIRQTMWFQHDGAPPHNSRRVRHYLDTRFPNSWIGRGGPVTWPARSPDLNPLDFFLWGYLKSIIYQDPIETLEELEEKLHCAVGSVTPEMLQLTQQSLIHRANACIQMAGLHFEHLL